ncbi:nucleotide exchange factor GrpE [Saccharopolyspora gloriosae]|uniref:nucleotide exchange factor GrpE n=1 Tax=Saccharopolyspora gloriosae TaxID=455344 RepID=UPI001FB6D2B4|nr:nucleotide exchange factor GrpE [Saccharopolyspora gloriosae]
MDDDRPGGPPRNALPMPAERRPARPHVVAPPRVDADSAEPPTTSDSRPGTDSGAADDSANPTRIESAPTDPEQITRLQGERDAHLETLRRVTADFDNYRKRMLREQTTHLDRAAENVLSQLLPVLDAVEIGARHHPEALNAVHKQLQQTLAAEGLHRIDPLDEPFDPVEHEAAPPEHPEPHTVIPLHHKEVEPGARITEVLRPGYRVHGHLIRPALVRVGQCSTR